MTSSPAPAAPQQPDPGEETPGEETKAADAALAQRAASSGEHLAGLIADGMLEVVGQPGKLPELLFPDIDPEHVRRVWDAALPVGYRAGKLAVAPRFNRETLTRLQETLAEFGWKAMARLSARPAAHAHGLPPTHPAEDEDLVRGEHW